MRGAVAEAPVEGHRCGVIGDRGHNREGISIRYEIADPMIFALCDLVCGKMERDVRCAAAVFHAEI